MIQDIESKTTHRLDNKTNNCKIIFFGSKLKYDLEFVFLSAINLDIAELENKLKKYE
jgi:hypothetical protein